MTVSPIDPVEDGITHINCYTSGRTRFGRAMSNLAPLSVTLPEHGYFASLEAYWFWLGTGQSHEELRHLSGFEARKAGKRLARVTHPEFETLFCKALTEKVHQHPGLCEAFYQNALPFTHYFYYGQPPNCKVIVPTSGVWQMTHLNDLRLGVYHRQQY